jgi:hypothetical protein
MIIEVLSIGTILICCGLLTWAAMKKYQSKINARLKEIESNSTGLEISKKRFR